MGNTETVTFTEDNSGPDAPQENTQQTEATRPEGLPEKFESVESLAESYSALEQKMGAGETAEEGEETAADQASEAIGAGAFEQYSQEYMENDGQLSEASYEALAKEHNFSKELVDSFIQGQEALSNRMLGEVHDTVGGAEKYQEIMEWATANLAESEIDAYNSTVEAGDASSINLALQGVHAKYAAENGFSPSLIQGTGKGRASGYESRQQMINDMAKPEYKTDPAFRDTVERRLASTPNTVI